MQSAQVCLSLQLYVRSCRGEGACAAAVVLHRAGLVHPKSPTP